MSAAEKVEVLKKIRPLPADNITLNYGGFAFNDWLVRPEQDTCVERMLESDFWQNVCRRFNRSDFIRVHDEVGGYYAELIVRDAGAHFCSVTLLRTVDLPKLHASDGETLPLGFAVEFKGPEQMWAAIRTEPNGRTQLLRDRFETKAAAMDYVLALGIRK